MATSSLALSKTIGMFVTSLFVATAANAQSQPVPGGADQILQEVVVTGSRLHRDSFTVSTPLVSVDAEALVDTGLASLAEILIDEVPSLYESSGNTTTQSSIGATGVTSVNLRELGSNRTLTLIDGRRTVQNSYSGKYVSLNTIPAGMVERVEVITGGSSAVYGSDAVAGVINIITEKDKVGFGLNTRGGYTPEGGGEEVTVDADYGTSFAGGRGYLFAAATFDRQYGIKNSDRDRAQIEADFDYNTTLLCNEMATETGDQCVRDIASTADYRDRSDGIFGGVFEERSTSSQNAGNGGFWYDESGLRSDWLEERDGVSSDIWEMIKVPDKQIAAALKVNYDLTDKTRAYVHLQYSRNESFNDKSPEDESEADSVGTIDRITGLPGQLTPGSISRSNPFVPPAVLAGASGTIQWDRRFPEVGNITTDNKRTTWRAWAGLQGEFDLFDDKWDWDVSVGYGNFEQYQIRSNEIDVVKEAQALNAELAPDGVTIQCADPAARAAGCVPLNLFGVGSVTAEMADWIRVNPILNPTIEQENFLAFVSGQLFDIPAGPVRTVFGVEYIRDSMDLWVSDELAYGGVTFNLVPPIKGSIDVFELFSEASLPLAKTLTADVSLRVADYSPKNISTVFSHTAGLIWEPVEGYIIRANFARAQRAPDIAELISPRRGDYDSFNDICDGATATSDATGHANCRLEPGIAATIAADGIFEDISRGYSPSAGNPDLFEETADTYTVGFSIAPSFLKGFRLAVDYFDITIADAIIEVDNEEILKQCYATSITFGDPNPFCDDITRGPDGQLQEVLQRQFNLNEQYTSGYDVALDYMIDLRRFGSLQLAGRYTHISEHGSKYDGVDGLEVVDSNNQLNYGIFKDVATASLTWRLNDLRVRWRTTWRGPIVDDQGRVDDYVALFATNDERCAAGAASCVTNPEVPAYLFYPSYFRHDLSVSYDRQLRNGAKLGLYGGVRNLFDDQGPFVPSTGDNSAQAAGNYHDEYGGGVGRFLYVGAQLRFAD